MKKSEAAGDGSREKNGKSSTMNVPESIGERVLQEEVCWREVTLRLMLGEAKTSCHSNDAAAT